MSSYRPSEHRPPVLAESSDEIADEVLASLNETLRLLQRSVGYFDGTAIAFDPDVLLPTQYASTFPPDRELARRACRNEQQEEDVYQWRFLARADPPISTLSAEHDSVCQTSIRWQQLLLPRGRLHELRAALVDPRGSCWGAFALYRRDRIRFSPSDVQAVRRLIPTRATHLARSMVTTRLPGTPIRPTSLLLDESGSVIDAPESALRWLDDINRSDTLDRVGMLLVSLAARVRFMRSTGDHGLYVQVRMRSSGGAWTTLIAESMSQGPRQRGIPVVLMATDSTQLFPLQVAAFGLTEREADVVRQVLLGLDTKSIAKRMSISVLTVQDHLKAIFDKTTVHSRRQLTYLLGGDSRNRGTTVFRR